MWSYASGSVRGANMLDKLTNTTNGHGERGDGKIDNFGFSSSTAATGEFRHRSSTTDAAHYITAPFAGNADDGIHLVPDQPGTGRHAGPGSAGSG